MHAGLGFSSPFRVYLQRLRRVSRSKSCRTKCSTHMSGPVSEQARGTTDLQAFHVVREEQVYKRYLALYNRRIRFPVLESRPAEEHDFDIIGHPQASFHFAAVFPFHPATDDKPAQVTILKEFCQGPNQMMYSLPAGSFDKERHGDYAGCARAELSEEAQLEGGEWVNLLRPGHPGIAEVKWCANRFTPFLCIGPSPAVTAGKMDAEEFIEVHRLGIPELRQAMRSGNMLLPSVTTAYLAIEDLQQRGYLV